MDKRLASQRGTPAEGQAISVACDKTTYAPEEPIVLTVCTKNVGNEDVRTWSSHPLAVYRIKVLFAGKELVPWTRCGKKQLDVCGECSRSTGSLKPGEEACVQLNLSRLLDFSLSGKYTISAQRGVWSKSDEGKALTVTSNTLEILVDEKLKPGVFHQRVMVRGEGNASDVPGEAKQ